MDYRYITGFCIKDDNLKFSLKIGALAVAFTARLNHCTIFNFGLGSNNRIIKI